MIALLVTAGVVVLLLILPFTRHLLWHLLTHAMGHFYEHHPGASLAVATILSWLFYAIIFIAPLTVLLLAGVPIWIALPVSLFLFVLFCAFTWHHYKKAMSGH